MIQATKNLNLLQKMVCYRQSNCTKQNNQNNSIEFDTESTKSGICDYSDAFILVTGDIKVNANNDTDVAFKNCAPFSTCNREINVFIDKANNIYIALPMYNLIKYSDNHSDTSKSLWQFKREKVPNNNVDLTIDNSQSFKYKAALVGIAL